VYCVANACTDDTEAVIRAAQLRFPDVELISTPIPGKISSVVMGAVAAQQAGYSHFLMLDDDIEWPRNEKGYGPDASPILVWDKEKPCTALPVLPLKASNWLVASQTIEYQLMVASKRAQGLLGNVIMASGAAGVFRLDCFLEAMNDHDGEHIGDDLQTCYIFHDRGYKIDLMPDTLVRTEPPFTLRAWWKQRAWRWEVSPILNIVWLLRAVFKKPTAGAGWWIRGVTVYRLGVSVFDMLRVFSFPFVLWSNPQILLGVWAISYVSVAMKIGVFRYFFKQFYPPTWNRVMWTSMLTYPVYGALMWLSRVASLPKAVYLTSTLWILGKRKRMEGFISSLSKGASNEESR